MNSKNNKMIINCIPIVATVLGLISIFLIFAPAVTISAGKYSIGDFSGVDAIFGYKIGDYSVLGFSFMNFLTYLILILAEALGSIYVLARFNIIKGLESKFKVVSIILAVFFLVIGIFMFLTVQFLSISGKDGLGLGAGAITGGIICLLASVAYVANIVLEKK